MSLSSRLTILKEYRKNGRYYVDCECSCGNITSSRKDYVLNGKKVSCGCIATERIQEVNRKGPGESAFNSFLAHYKVSARKRNLSFSITAEEFKNMTSKNCYYCGSPPKEKTFNKSQTPIIANGIDRIDSNIGYEVDNCRPCCYICNIMKSNLSEKDFYEHIDKITEHKCNSTT